LIVGFEWYFKKVNCFTFLKTPVSEEKRSMICWKRREASG